MSEICLIYTLDKFEICDMPKIHTMDGLTLIWIKCDLLSQLVSDEMNTRDAYASKNLTFMNLTSLIP